MYVLFVYTVFEVAETDLVLINDSSCKDNFIKTVISLPLHKKKTNNKRRRRRRRSGKRSS